MYICYIFQNRINSYSKSINSVTIKQRHDLNERVHAYVCVKSRGNDWKPLIHSSCCEKNKWLYMQLLDQAASVDGWSWAEKHCWTAEQSTKKCNPTFNAILQICLYIKQKRELMWKKERLYIWDGGGEVDRGSNTVSWRRYAAGSHLTHTCSTLGSVISSYDSSYLF
jgi:hypothetical protein